MAWAAGANLVGSDLYNKLSEYFIKHFGPMLQVQKRLCFIFLVLIAC
jgi:cullin 1